MTLKYFKISEFNCKSQPGSGSNMKPEFLQKLDAAREMANTPFKINSGFRTVAHNKKVGGVDNSPHTKGWACDIAYSSGTQAFRILTALLAVGFNRIGVYKTFIHVDSDPDLPANVIWSK